MVAKQFSMTAGAVALTLSLAACGTGGTSTDTDAMDEALLGQADNSDPALTVALEDQIMVDQDLSNQSNQNAALPGNVVSSAPIPDTLDTMQDAQDAISGGRLLTAPLPIAVEDGNGRSAAQGQTTQGAMAQRQAGDPAVNSCSGTMQYGIEWAATLPRAFTIYSGAEVIEASGYNQDHCRMRVVSFRTRVPMDHLINWYYTRAIRSGFSAEHQLRHGNNVLGGFRERDEAAFYLVFAPLSGGGTTVDVVVSNGT